MEMRQCINCPDTYILFSCNCSLVSLFFVHKILLISLIKTGANVSESACVVKRERVTETLFYTEVRRRALLRIMSQPTLPLFVYIRKIYLHIKSTNITYICNKGCGTFSAPKFEMKIGRFQSGTNICSRN